MGTDVARACDNLGMSVSRDSATVGVTISAEHFVKLNRIAERMCTESATLAGELLSRAIDEADPGADDLTELLNQIPGALERAERGRRQALKGKTIPLDQL